MFAHTEQAVSEILGMARPLAIELIKDLWNLRVLQESRALSLMYILNMQTHRFSPSPDFRGDST